MLTEAAIASLAEEWQQLEPKEILKAAAERMNSPLPLISFSGAEDVILIDMAVKLGWEPRIITLDTGRLHPETYRFIEEVRSHYGVSIEMLYPDPIELGNFTKNKGLFSFYEDGHEQCCGIRKVEPLRRRLQGESAWITGRRRDQSPSRALVQVIEPDPQFSGEEGQLLKLNPLANWSSEQVWGYIRLLELPYNELHDRGFISIGCEPCTRAVGPGQHEREGRWWWEEATIKECGLHLAANTDTEA